MSTTTWSKALGSSLRLLVALALILLGLGGTGQGGQALQKVRYIYFPAAHSAVVFVAKQYGLFQREGLDVELIQGQTGIQMMNAVVSSDVEFTNNHLGVIGQVYRQGRHPLFVYSYTRRATLDLVVRNETLTRLGVSPTDPLEKRMAALAGMKIGVTGPGSESDIFPRYFLRRAGRDPDREATIISVGSAANLLAAFRTGQIDAFMLTPPTPQVPALDGLGQIFISLSRGDVPEFRTFQYQGIVVMKEFAERNPDAVVRFIRALMRADQIIRSSKDRTLDALAAYLTGDRRALSVAYDALIDAWARPEMTHLSRVQVQTQLNRMEGMGFITYAAPAGEGELWTNQYRDEAFRSLTR